VSQVGVLLERLGALGHATFGGRLAADAKGFPAAAMAKTHAGDWRNPEQVRGWAADIARALPGARPRVPVEHPARALGRWVAYGGVGWALSASVAIALHALVAPLIYIPLAARYFGARGARDPLPTAAVWTAMAAVLSAVAAWVGGRTDLLTRIAGTWLPLALIFLATWLTGLVVSTLPWPKPPERAKGGTRGAVDARGTGHAAEALAPGATRRPG
jgi:hypothetical protein